MHSSDFESGWPWPCVLGFWNSLVEFRMSVLWQLYDSSFSWKPTVSSTKCERIGGRSSSVLTDVCQLFWSKSWVITDLLRPSEAVSFGLKIFQNWGFDGYLRGKNLNSERLTLRERGERDNWCSWIQNYHFQIPLNSSWTKKKGKKRTRIPGIEPRAGRFLTESDQC
jgi:hypothetical protein